MAITALIALSATGTYENAIVIAKNDDDAANVLALSMLICITVSLLVFIFGLFFNKGIALLLGNPDLAIWLYLVPVSVLFVSFYQALTYWAVRKQQYNRIANTGVLRSIVNSAINLSMGFAHFGVSGLILGQLIGQGVAAGILGWQLWRQDNDAHSLISRKKIIELAKEYRDFPRYNLIHAFLDGIRDNGVIFLINYFFDVTVLGYYSLSLRVLRTPLNIIGSSISQVFYQQIARAKNTGHELWPYLKKILQQLAVISLPVFLILAILGPQVFAFVFGEQWKNAGVYTQILIPWIAINFVSSPISVVPLVLMKQKPFLFVGIGYNILIFLTFGIGAATTTDIIFTLACVSAVASIYLIGMLVWVANLSKIT
jgi:O-antigen/teichoic acid export membrane protein